MISQQFYRIVYDYHKRWSPCPTTADEWEKAGKEAAAACYEHGNDPFLTDLLCAVYGELGREYKALREIDRGDAAIAITPGSMRTRANDGGTV